MVAVIVAAMTFVFGFVYQVDAIGITPPSIAAGTIAVNTTQINTIYVLRSADELGSIDVTVELRGLGTQYISGESSFTIPAGTDVIEYSFGISPDSTATDGSYETRIDFYASDGVIGSGSAGAAVKAGVTAVIDFTVSGATVTSESSTSSSGIGGGSSRSSSGSSSTDTSNSNDAGSTEASDSTDVVDPEDIEQDDSSVSDESSSEQESGDTQDSSDGSQVSQTPQDNEVSSDTSTAENNVDTLTSDDEVVIPLLPERTLIPSSDIPPPALTSKTHPSSSTWYASRWLEVNWQDETHQDGDSYWYLLTQDPNAQDGVFTLRSHPSLQHYLADDGIWYLHVARERDGMISDTTTLTVAVDTVAPEPFKAQITGGVIGAFSSKEVQEFSEYYLVFRAIDNTSGVAWYDVVSEGEVSRVTDSYLAIDKADMRGKEYIIIASDFAGNTVSSSVIVDDLSVKPTGLKYIVVLFVTKMRSLIEWLYALFAL